MLDDLRCFEGFVLRIREESIQNSKLRISASGW
jgi:hypothetical protein